MKSAVFAGAIAGIVCGIVETIMAPILVDLLKILEAPGGQEIWDLPMIMLALLASISLGLIWGSIFAMIYNLIYGVIPGRGVMKGLRFGLMIWLVKDIAAASYLATWLQIPLAKAFILYGSFMWIAYGLVLGALYRKPGD